MKKANWSTIEDACDLVTDGTHYTPPNLGHGVPFLTVKDMTDNGLDFYGCSFISEAEYLAALNGNSAPKIGDVLFSKDGTVGKVHIVKENVRFAILSSIAILRPNPLRLDSNYFGQALRSPNILNQAIRRKTGSAIRRIILGDLKQVRFPLPPLNEQRRIAVILDKADALREKRRQALAKLDTLLQAVFLRMFGDPVTNPKRWPVKALGELLNFTTGKLDSNAAKEGGQYPFFTCSKETFQIDNYAFDCEALLLAGNNANADYSVKHYKGKFNAYQRTYVITLKNKSHSYLYFKLALEKKLQDLKRLSKGTNTKYLTLSILQNITVQVPPPDLQQSFEAKCQAINGQVSKQQVFLQRAEELFTSLQKFAFTGEPSTERAALAMSQSTFTD